MSLRVIPADAGIQKTWRQVFTGFWARLALFLFRSPPAPLAKGGDYKARDVQSCKEKPGLINKMGHLARSGEVAEWQRGRVIPARALARVRNPIPDLRLWRIAGMTMQLRQVLPGIEARAGALFVLSPPAPLDKGGDYGAGGCTTLQGNTRLDKQDGALRPPTVETVGYFIVPWGSPCDSPLKGALTGTPQMSHPQFTLHNIPP